MNQGLTWSSEEMRCLLDIWADDHIAQQSEKRHTNQLVIKMFSELLKERGFDRHDFWPINGMIASTDDISWYILVHLRFSLSKTKPMGKCKWVATHLLIWTKWTELQVWKHSEKQLALNQHEIHNKFLKQLQSNIKDCHIAVHRREPTTYVRKERGEKSFYGFRGGWWTASSDLRQFEL